MPQRNMLAKGRGWPNALQARQIVQDEADRIGKESLANALGMSQGYLRLVLRHERMPTHQLLLNYFGWQHVYEVEPEDDL